MTSRDIKKEQCKNLKACLRRERERCRPEESIPRVTREFVEKQYRMIKDVDLTGRRGHVPGHAHGRPLRELLDPTVRTPGAVATVASRRSERPCHGRGTPSRRSR
jgi:hypothetical protein